MAKSVHDIVNSREVQEACRDEMDGQLYSYVPFVCGVLRVYSPDSV